MNINKAKIYSAQSNPIKNSNQTPFNRQTTNPHSSPTPNPTNRPKLHNKIRPKPLTHHLNAPTHNSTHKILSTFSAMPQYSLSYSNCSISSKPSSKTSKLTPAWPKTARTLNSLLAEVPAASPTLNSIKIIHLLILWKGENNNINSVINNRKPKLYIISLISRSPIGPNNSFISEWRAKTQNLFPLGWAILVNLRMLNSCETRQTVQQIQPMFSSVAICLAFRTSNDSAWS